MKKRAREAPHGVGVKPGAKNGQIRLNRRRRLHWQCRAEGADPAARFGVGENGARLCASLFHASVISRLHWFVRGEREMAKEGDREKKKERERGKRREIVGRGREGERERSNDYEFYFFVYGANRRLV